MLEPPVTPLVLQGASSIKPLEFQPIENAALVEAILLLIPTSRLSFTNTGCPSIRVMLEPPVTPLVLQGANSIKPLEFRPIENAALVEAILLLIPTSRLSFTNTGCQTKTEQ